MKKKLILSMFIGCLSLTTAKGQTSQDKWAAGVHVGIEQYKGELGSGFFKFGQTANGLIGLDISRYLTPHFDVAIHTTYGDMGYYNNTDPVVFTRTNMFQANIQGRYNILTDASKWRPYLFAGFGHALFTDGDFSQRNTIIPYGLGLTYQVNPKIALRLQETFIYSDFDRMDGDASKKFNDSYLQHSIALVFNFGNKTKDADGDGIVDEMDKCPNIAGALVTKGCPDTDGDGVIDEMDKCPKIAGVEATSGCPDTDGDGVADEMDKCPNLAGTLATEGCPDADGDGVTDEMDKCPNLAGDAATDGCPDTDGDGITDDKDKCPSLAGTESGKGCPDKDGDGVADNDDSCPEVVGLLLNSGCPEIAENDVEVLKSALHGINFKTGKDIINSNSFGILDNVVGIMKKHPEYKLVIEGHTDSQGNDDLNMELSKKRATAVKNYLTQKGVESNRLTANGYGETKPVADNGTKEGRAENRRVELKIEFK